MIGNIFLAVVAYLGIGLVGFILGGVFLQKKIEKKTGIGYRNFTQTQLLMAISRWKSAWDRPKCKICKAPCLDDQIGQANPLCPEHEEEQRQREKFMSAGRGQDPETAKEE